jgi:hypothetical protein
VSHYTPGMYSYFSFCVIAVLHSSILHLPFNYCYHLVFINPFDHVVWLSRMNLWCQWNKICLFLYCMILYQLPKSTTSILFMVYWMILSLVQTLYQIRDGKLIRITKKGQMNGDFVMQCLKILCQGDCGEQHRPFEP